MFLSETHSYSKQQIVVIIINNQTEDDNNKNENGHHQRNRTITDPLRDKEWQLNNKTLYEIKRKNKKKKLHVIVSYFISYFFFFLVSSIYKTIVIYIKITRNTGQALFSL